MQTSLNFPLTSPPPYSGTQLTSGLNGAFWSLATVLASGSAPTASGLGLSSLAGVFWHDTSGNALYVRDQADTTWIFCATFDETNKRFSARVQAPIVTLAAGVTGYTCVSGDYGKSFNIDTTSGNVLFEMPFSLGGSGYAFWARVTKTSSDNNQIQLTGDGINVYAYVISQNTAAGAGSLVTEVDGSVMRVFGSP